VTATRDRRSDPETDAGPAWDDRPIIGQFRGLPWWGAVLLAFGLSAVAAVVDMQRQDSLGKIYQGAFIVGCVAAIGLVRRRSLFGPMVQPPLVFAITAVGAVALLSAKSASGLKALLLSVALPLTSNFPTMGGTTAAVVAIGLYRWWRERDPDPDMRPNRPVKEPGPGLGLDDEPGQSSGGRPLRERAAAAERAAAPPRRGRPEPDGARDAAREPRRREPAPGRAERADRRRAERAEPSADRGRGRSRGGGAEPPAPRRREPGADGGRGRDERGKRDTEPERDGGREGRGGTPGRQPRRRPPESRR
jgi:hypothetical protein